SADCQSAKQQVANLRYDSTWPSCMERFKSTVPSKTGYKLVKLASGAHSVHSVAHGETFHPVIGPVAEAEALYVNQIRLRDRLKNHSGEFVIWDVGLGAAANALAVLRATRGIACNIRLVSFDHTIEPLEFALGHAADLGYFGGYENHLNEFIRAHRVAFQDGRQSVDWEFHLDDFPTFLSNIKLKTQNSKFVPARCRRIRAARFCGSRCCWPVFLSESAMRPG